MYEFFCEVCRQSFPTDKYRGEATVHMLNHIAVALAGQSGESGDD